MVRITAGKAVPDRHEAILNHVHKGIFSSNLSGYQKYCLLQEWRAYLFKNKRLGLALEVFDKDSIQSSKRVSYVVVDWARIPMYAWVSPDGKYAGITIIDPTDDELSALHITEWPEWMLFDEVPPPGEKVN